MVLAGNFGHGHSICGDGRCGLAGTQVEASDGVPFQGAVMAQLALAHRAMIGGRQQYLAFAVGGETYAISIAGVKELIQYGGVTAMPDVPDYIRGVINLRGAVVPVVDLGARFGRGASAQVRRSCIVIIEGASGETGQDIGMMVDAVHTMLEIDDGDIDLPRTFGASIRADFIQGMAKVGGRMVVILDVAAVLSLDEIALLAGMEEQAA
jgi:purine-binding chemotaxis protein CheW